MIILGATPIGNLGDASPRLREAFETCPIVAAEDTRTTIQLMRALGIEARPKLVALHEHNERAESAALVETARTVDVLVVSDAGMPGVSDPGFVLVQTAIAAGVDVTCIPGPSAVLTALTLSGFPTDRFSFEGFLPRKSGERRALFESLRSESRTAVLFESPHRLAESLADLDATLPERTVAVCRELTKKFEEVRRGTASSLLDWAKAGVKGEIVLVLAAAERRNITFAQGLAQVQQLVREGTRLKDATAEVAEATGLQRRALYQAALDAS
ncbi:16S rRNA (cytidine(1402)-2'-O)-methyltransferase [Humidisolicoccus flavus]|uniref:16S rRNA (cytidine(1402)-2'-O)-methyltransferase n=1 Tax=Humidisolicoccus flavus TaxID=3111414 RepID=UPI00325680F7